MSSLTSTSLIATLWFSLCTYRTVSSVPGGIQVITIGINPPGCQNEVQERGAQGLWWSYFQLGEGRVLAFNGCALTHPFSRRHQTCLRRVGLKRKCVVLLFWFSTGKAAIIHPSEPPPTTTSRYGSSTSPVWSAFQASNRQKWSSLSRHGANKQDINPPFSAVRGAAG